MASWLRQRGPVAVPRNATGLVKGWSGFDAFAYSFMSVNLVTLGMFYSLAVFALRARGEPGPVDRPRGDRGDVPADRLRRPHRGDAAGGRRLRLAEPRPRRHPRRR